jgi:hypothetical protein
MASWSSKRGFFLAIAATGAVLLVGCELIVDFDRSKIPVEDTDSGVIPIPGSDAQPPDTGAPDTGGETGAGDGGDGGGGGDAPSDAPQG